MKELLGILSSLVRPACGFVVQLLTLQYGVRPLLSVAAQALLQYCIVTYAFNVSPAGAAGLTALFVLFHVLGAFRVLAVGIGLAFETDNKKPKGETPEETTRRHFQQHAVSGYIADVGVAFFSIGLTVFFCRHLGGSTSALVVAWLASVFVGGLIDVVGVLMPLYRSFKAMDEQNSNG